MSDKERIKSLEHTIFSLNQVTDNDRRIINDFNIKVRQLSEINQNLIFENHRLNKELNELKNTQQNHPNE